MEAGSLCLESTSLCQALSPPPAIPKCMQSLSWSNSPGPRPASCQSPLYSCLSSLLPNPPSKSVRNPSCLQKGKSFHCRLRWPIRPDPQSRKDPISGPYVFSEGRDKEPKQKSIKVSPNSDLAIDKLVIETSVCLNTKCHCSVAKSCPTLGDPMDYSTPGLPTPHYLSESVQVHIPLSQ